MKKIVSLLLALVMVLSLGVAAFAVDAEDANTTTTEEATPTVTIDQILEWIKGTIMPEKIETGGENRPQIVALFTTLGYAGFTLDRGREIPLTPDTTKDIIFRHAH